MLKKQHKECVELRSMGADILGHYPDSLFQSVFPMRFCFRYLESDFQEAAALHGRRWLIRFALPYFLIFSGLAFWWTWNWAPGRLGYPMGFILFLGGVIAFKWCVQMRLRVRKDFRQQTTFRQEVTMTLDEEQLVMEHADGLVRKSWGDFRKYRATDQIILIYLSDYLFFVLPRRVLSEEDWRSARELIVRKVLA